MRARLRDERGIITGALFRYVAILVVLGVILIEGGSILYTYIRLQNATDAAAVAGADAWSQTGNIRVARRTIRNELDTKDQEAATIVEVEADGPPDFEVRVTTRREAPTILVQRIGFLRGLGEVEVEASARPVQPGV